MASRCDVLLLKEGAVAHEVFEQVGYLLSPIGAALLDDDLHV